MRQRDGHGMAIELFRIENEIVPEIKMDFPLYMDRFNALKNFQYFSNIFLAPK